MHLSEIESRTSKSKPRERSADDWYPYRAIIFNDGIQRGHSSVPCAPTRTLQICCQRFQFVTCATSTVQDGSMTKMIQVSLKTVNLGPSSCRATRF